MAHQVPWDTTIFEEFCALAMLSELEEEILRTRIQGHSITKQALEFNLSESSISRIISVLKEKYDKVQVRSSLLPPRKLK